LTTAEQIGEELNGGSSGFIARILEIIKEIFSKIIEFIKGIFSAIGL
jgi:phage-related protein